MNALFEQYTPEYISRAMSLRKPQEEALRILSDILENVQLRKGGDLTASLAAIHALYPTLSDFERDFVSLSFSLATGVGKTRLMGAFIAYLYTQKNIRNFFVVAPNTTIYDKLRSDLSDQNSAKYVFRGLDCFRTTPKIITEDDYKERQISIYDSDIRIFIYNIDKFNKESASMRKVSEIIGESFYSYLSSLPDLTLIMDESHHYRAERGMAALNDLKPLLGLELTATPLVSKGSKQIPFKNVVYEYPLSKAIADGYTRTPFAVTRSGVDFFNFGEEEIDRLMLSDGILCHERAKKNLALYAENSGKTAVKPFMLVVCKDTEHAEAVEKYIRSDEFRSGAYRNKTITVHSKQGKSESDENLRLLLGVESPENPVEIVIHVNMLKEGWDVNNLYTIVPLRTATSKILREQMVGRGLRLPYGERTGDEAVDAVMLTAHDKFADILSEAQKGDSIFKAGNIIKAEELEGEKVEQAQIAMDTDAVEMRAKGYERTGLSRSAKMDAIMDKLNGGLVGFAKKGILSGRENAESEENAGGGEVTIKNLRPAIDSIAKELEEDPDLGETFAENKGPLLAWMGEIAEETAKSASEKYIPIPQLKITEAGEEEYVFTDFEPELGEFNHAPIQNEMLVQNLEDPRDLKRIAEDAIDFKGYWPEKVLLERLCEKPEIDYERCQMLLTKLVGAVCGHYLAKYGENGLQNIVMMYKKDISNRIYAQMMQHFYIQNGFIREEVMSVNSKNLAPSYSFRTQTDIFGDFDGDIRSVLFTGIRKGVFDIAKFDSCEGELTFARLLERDPDVLKWLRPHPQEFNIKYNGGHRYEPDFVVEGETYVYLVEVKGEDKLKDPDVLAKKERGIEYCEAASRWCKANGFKEWRYLFIPAGEIKANASFTQLAERFGE